eukprot:TRINITY_DN1276_c0_g1_i1.p1 TRINITY_DN1276_c0_g1~~TRINITY_DN1276_c0_g1_i1.p1  ORF type:complete len:516 (+),score=83.24 TRINITY_DN1276_c0_g1_i1:61-1608(+)
MAAKISPSSLYVGDLATEVTENELFETFNTVGPVASIRVCRDSYKPFQSLGYAYVNFHNPTHAERALELLNNKPILGKPCRIMWSQRDPSLRKSGLGNIFIKNLDATIGIKELHDTFTEFGEILSCKVAVDDNGKSKGFGFVHFKNNEDAQKAIERVNGLTLKGKKVYVGLFLPERERLKNWTNIYVKNLDPSTTEEDLENKFSEFGKVINVAIRRDENNVSKGFGFVNFERHEDAERAVRELDSTDLGTSKIYCNRHHKKNQMRSHERLPTANLFIKNLEDDVDDDVLRLYFQPYGHIISAKVMVDERNNSRGFGFVCYSNYMEAQRAIEAMHANVLPGCSKALYVAPHEPKDVRRMKLVQQFSIRKLNPSAIPPYPYYVPPFYASPPPAYPVPRASNWHHGPSQQSSRPPRSYQGGRGGRSGPPPQHQRRAYEDQANFSAIPEEQRRLYLGEKLFPLISAIEPALAGKITGMLLDSGWTLEALTGLVSDPASLAGKVKEAKEVLEKAQKDNRT